jgi:hypothetical protein
MTELKKIITNLDEVTCKSLETDLLRNQGDNFLFLFKSYRENSMTDEKIIKKLKMNSNSFYVLKSRLHEKVKHHLVGNVTISQQDILKQMILIPEMCYDKPRILADTFLHKLEKDLAFYDMHHELLQVYGALKKIHIYSEKHFYYSQLYNRQVALSFCLEKSEEILGEFNRLLAQYNFSRSEELLEKLLFLRKEMVNNVALNPSRQIRIIKNTIELQLLIFCKTDLKHELNEVELLESTQKTIEELPLSSPYKKWGLILDFLYFEYYQKTGQLKHATDYFERTDAHMNNLFLYTGMCNTSRFLISKITFLVNTGKLKLLAHRDLESLRYSDEDMHTKVLLGIYSVMSLYYSRNINDAIEVLNQTIDLSSFKDYQHINLELKLTLVFLYIEAGNFEEAKVILARLQRNVTAKKSSNYAYIYNLFKLFASEIEENPKITLEERKDLFTLFVARNNGEYELLQHLMPVLNKKYS